MAVVVSQSQNEIDDLRKKGLDIEPHRKRMQTEDIEAKFKDAKDPLRLVFVCAMWITGFDVPSIGTVYLDKPMKNHADADHRPRQPQGGGEDLGRDRGLCGGLQQPAEGAGGLCWRGQRRGGEEGKKPIEDKAALVEALNIALNAAHAFALAQKVDTLAMLAAEPLARLKLITAGVEALVSPDEVRKSSSG
jgi:type I restriction enzyme R subunit